LYLRQVNLDPLEPIPIEWSISGASEVVGTFLRREAIKQVSERIPKTRDGARGKLSEQRLQLGEGLLDRRCGPCTIGSGIA
jgi:hypothetical protein